MESDGIIASAISLVMTAVAEDSSSDDDGLSKPANGEEIGIGNCEHATGQLQLQICLLDFPNHHLHSLVGALTRGELGNWTRSRNCLNIQPTAGPHFQ